jgi:hypothetical protein
MTFPVRGMIKIAVALMAGVAAYSLVPAPLPELSRADFLKEVRAGHIRRVEIEDQEVIISESTTRGSFRTGFDRTQDIGLPDELRGLGVEVLFSKSPPGI